MLGNRPQQHQRQVNVADVMKNLSRYIDDKVEGIERLQDAAQVLDGLTRRVDELQMFIQQNNLQIPAVGSVQPKGQAPFQPKELKKEADGAKDASAPPEQAAAAATEG